MKRATILKLAVAVAAAAVLWNTLDVESYKKPKNKNKKNNPKKSANKKNKWWSWKNKKPKKQPKKPKKPMSWASYNTKYAPIRAQEAQQLPAAIAAFAAPSPAIAALAAPLPAPYAPTNQEPVAGLNANNPNNVIEGPIPGGNYNVYAPPDALNNGYYNNAMAYFKSDPVPVQDTSQMTIVPDGGGPVSYKPRPLQDEFGRTYYSGGY